MNALPFLHPALLWGAALFTVPLIIHLLNRRRFRTISWAAMDFLLAAYRKRRKKLELENLLLLILRCAIPVVLALVFARPWFGAHNLLANLAEAKREVVVVLDESYSMDRRVGAGTQFQAALDQIRRLVASLDFERGDRLTLATLAREPRLLCVSAGQGDFERRLATLARPTWESADLGRTLDLLLNEVLKQIPAMPEVWLVSDFQRTTFEESRSEEAKPDETKPAARATAAAGADATSGTLVGKMQRLSQLSSLHLVNLSDGTLPPEDLSVVDLRASEPLAIAGKALRLTATVTRSGRTPGGTGHFRIGDADRAQSFTFDAEGKATVEIWQSFAEAGDQGVEFRLDEDELPDDDARWLRVPVKAGIPVLVVDGQPSGGDPLAGAAGNVLLILDPLFNDAEAQIIRRFFEPTVIPWFELGRGKADFAKYDAVILVNVREIEAEKVAPELSAYVDGGGGVLVFLGDQTRPETWNERFYKADGSGLLPLKIAGEAKGEAYSPDVPAAQRTSLPFRVEIADELHPAVRTFADDRRRFFLTSPVFRYWPFVQEGVAPQDLRVVLRYKGSGDPALLEHRVGRGHVLWCNVSGAADDWSLFSQTPNAFFPLVWDMVSHLAVRDPSAHALQIGGTIAKSVGSPPLSWSVTPPSGAARTSTKIPPAVQGQYRLDEFSDTKTPGLYALDVTFGADEPPVHELYAVNVDPRESELKFLDGEQIHSLYERVAIASYGREIAPQEKERAPERQGEIWKRLLLALLALVLLETVLAWRFGAWKS